MDIDVTSIPDRISVTQAIQPTGWSLAADRSNFKPTKSVGVDDKGSFALGILFRAFNPPILTPISYEFDSFDYGCLLWEVGSSAALSFANSQEDGLHLFVQGIRKGYRDSQIMESHLLPDDVFDAESPTISPVMDQIPPTSFPVDATTSPSLPSSAAESLRFNGIGLLAKLCAVFLLIDALVGN